MPAESPSGGKGSAYPVRRAPHNLVETQRHYAKTGRARQKAAPQNITQAVEWTANNVGQRKTDAHLTGDLTRGLDRPGEMSIAIANQTWGYPART
jgi:hypothetical protein